MTLRAIKGATTISVDSAREICVGTGALPRCIRALLHVQHSASTPIRHIYLRDAAGLRPDIATSP